MSPKAAQSASNVRVAALRRSALILANAISIGFRSGEGTVNLIGSGRDKAPEGRSHERLCASGHAGDRGPGLEGLGPGGSILAGGAVIAAEGEEVGNLIVSGEEALSLAGRLEALHLPFSSSGRLVRILGSVIQMLW